MNSINPMLKYVCLRPYTPRETMEKICVAVRLRPPATIADKINGTFWKVEDDRISLHKPLGTAVSGVAYAFGPTSRMNPGKSRQSETSIVPVAVTTLIEGSSSVGSNGSAVEEETSRLGKLKFSDGQHVIIPNHIQIPHLKQEAGEERL